MSPRSALYIGSVMHRRLRPRPHCLRYRVFWLLLDLDEIDELARTLRLFSRGRFNVASFYDGDYGDCSGSALRSQVEGHLREAGLETDGGRIMLLSMPRIFGYCFNPLSIYFCHHRDGSLAAILYEVRNTFGERHSYLIPVPRDAGPVIDQRCRKVFYVSPFMDMNLSYAFRVRVPAETVSVAVSAADATGLLLTAVLSGNRTPLNDTALLRAVLTHPLLTFKVIGAIHWHALRMLLKGFALRKRPAPPPTPVTIAGARTAER